MFRWLKKPTPPRAEPDRIRQYRITRKVGEGGMGVVYEAQDERLGRPVAIKRLRSVSSDPSLRDRLQREARIAAGISHPNVCQVYELGEENGELFIVMEFLAGDSLADRIARGPIPLAEALQTTLGILSALEALHSRGVVHRDLKPSNVFLTPHGVKLLDFGLARPLAADLAGDPGLTQAGVLLGTPRYMAPEQWNAEPVTPGSDLFAVGAILYEMLAAKPAYAGETAMQIYHAVTHGQPPALAGSAEVLAADRLIQRALAVRPADRYPDAAAMAQEVREALTLIDTGAVPRVRSTRRLIVLPFRSLRPDPDTEFLASSLPDAITASLSGVEALVVRSTAAAQRFAGEAPDLKAVAAEAGVDVVLMGTLLRAGDQVRVSAQLVEVPSGTIVSTRTAQVGLTDIFQLQDELTRQIVDALAIPLSSRDQDRLGHDVPCSAHAYELYLRANHMAEGVSNPSRLAIARDLYSRCLEEDPQYAPAWARLGRVHRVMSKYGHDRTGGDLRKAEAAFRRALEINPDLPLAHNLYTYFAIEELGQAKESMLRLLKQVELRAADPHLFAGLVVACRFCGLLLPSLAADQRARRIDPTIRTSVNYTHWLSGDYERAALTDEEEIQVVRHGALWMMGREEEALTGIRELEAHPPAGTEGWFTSLRAAFELRRDESVEAAQKVMDIGFHDPEGLLFFVRNYARVGDIERALATLERSIAGGFSCPAPLVRDPWLDPLRTKPQFVRLLRVAEERHAVAAEAYSRAGGERILGPVG